VVCPVRLTRLSSPPRYPQSSTPLELCVQYFPFCTVFHITRRICCLCCASHTSYPSLTIPSLPRFLFPFLLFSTTDAFVRVLRTYYHTQAAKSVTTESTTATTFCLEFASPAIHPFLVSLASAAIKSVSPCRVGQDVSLPLVTF
jgi:hypothetical protein